MVVRRNVAAALVVAGFLSAAVPSHVAYAAAEDEALKQAAQAIKAGKAEAAIKLISNVIASKGATPAIVAKGYYLRGLAYQKSGKPAQAVADVSQALWLKQLSASDAAEAQKIRAAGLGGAGKALTDAGPEKVAAPAVANADPAASGGWSTDAVADANVSEAKPKQKPATEAAGWNVESVAEPSAVAAPVAAEPESSSSVGGFFSSLFSSGSSEPPTQSFAPAAGVDAAPAAEASGWSSGLAMAPEGDSGGWAASQPEAVKTAKVKAKSKEPAVAADSWQVAAVEPAAPVVAEQPAASSGGFFGDLTNSVSSLFGGGSSESVPDQTASLSKPKATANSAWSSEVAGASGDGSVYEAPAAVSSGFSTSVEAASGSFLLQVASASSPADAKAEAARIASLDPALAAQVQQRIVEADLGSGGRFYNVQMGPFASEKASLQACNRLKRMGVGCFLVVQ